MYEWTHVDFKMNCGFAGNHDTFCPCVWEREWEEWCKIVRLKLKEKGVYPVWFAFANDQMQCTKSVALISVYKNLRISSIANDRISSCPPSGWKIFFPLSFFFVQLKSINRAIKIDLQKPVHSAMQLQFKKINK